jgi:hypothetical protein
MARPLGARRLPLALDACLKGARMPSMADEVETEATTVRSRTFGSRRYGLAEVSFEPMDEVYIALERPGY